MSQSRTQSIDYAWFLLTAKWFRPRATSISPSGTNLSCSAKLNIPDSKPKSETLFNAQGRRSFELRILVISCLFRDSIFALRDWNETFTLQMTAALHL